MEYTVASRELVLAAFLEPTQHQNAHCHQTLLPRHTSHLLKMMDLIMMDKLTKHSRHM